MAYPILASLMKRIVFFLNIYSWLIVIDATLTIFSRPKDKDIRLKRLLKKIADPINNVFRKVLRQLGSAAMPVDISPLLSLIAIWIVSGLINLASERFYELYFSF